MNYQIQNLKLKTGLLLAALCVFTFQSSILNCSADNVRFYFQQNYSADLDTNAFIATPISSNILANGSVIQTGLPRRFTPATNGYSTNYLNIGWYAVSNVVLRRQPIVIAVTSASTST